MNHVKIFFKFFWVLILSITVIGFSDYKTFAAERLEYTDEELDESCWMRVLGKSGEQDSIDNVAGFDYNSLGAVIGYDNPVDFSVLGGSFVLGGSLGFLSTDVQSDYIDFESDISTINLGGYGSYNRDNMYIDSIIMYAYSDISNSKIGGLKGDTSSNAFSLALEAGYNFLYRKKIFIAAFAGFQSSILDMSSYKEKDYSETDISEVDSVSDFFFSTLLGLSVNYPIKQNLDLKCTGMWSHEFSDDLQSSYKLTTIDSTEYTEANGLDINPDRFTFGIGLIFKQTDAVSISTDYNIEASSDFISHTGSLLLRWTY